MTRLLQGLAIACVLAALVESAAANRVEVTNQSIRLVWAELRVFTPDGVSSTCPVTLEGTFHARTFAKTSGLLVGYITESKARITDCVFSGGVEGFAFLPVPYHIRWTSFRGTLPRIRKGRFQILGVGIQLRALGVTCLYKSSSAAPLFLELELNEETGEAIGAEADETAPIPLFEGSFFCPEGIRASRRATVTLLNSTNKIRLRLI
jgi:hypothetical protein